MSSESETFVTAQPTPGTQPGTPAIPKTTLPSGSSGTKLSLKDMGLLFILGLLAGAVITALIFILSLNSRKNKALGGGEEAGNDAGEDAEEADSLTEKTGDEDPVDLG